MTVTDIFQRCGRVSVSLESPPLSIIRLLEQALGDTGNPAEWGPRDGYLVFTNTKSLPLEDVGLDKASQTFVLTKRTGRYTWEGRTLELYLGTSDRPGPFRIIEPLYRDGANMAQVAADFIVAPFTANVTEPGGTIDYTWPTATTYAEMLDHATDLFPGCSWRVNPDLSVDIGPDNTVVNVAPSVIITPTPVADYAAGTEVRGVRGTATRLLDVENATHAGTAFGTVDAPDPGFLSQTVFSTRPTTRDPIGGTEMATTRVVDLPQTITNNQLLSAAQATVNLWQTPRAEFEVVCPASARVHDFIRRGDKVWVYDPVGGAVDETNHQVIRGIDTFPLEATVIEIDYAPTGGLYLLRHDGVGQTFTDLTPWMAEERTDTVLRVSTKRGALDRATTKPARFAPEIADRIGLPQAFQVTVVDITQGGSSVPFTVLRSEFLVQRGQIEWYVDIDITGTGSNNQEIIMTLDPTEWGETSIGSGDTFAFADVSSGTLYNGLTIARSATTLAFVSTGNSNGIGRTPNISLGPGDVLQIKAREAIG